MASLNCLHVLHLECLYQLNLVHNSQLREGKVNWKKKAFVVILICLPSRGWLFGDSEYLLCSLKSSGNGQNRFSHTEVSWAWAVLCCHLSGSCAILMSICLPAWLKRPGFSFLLDFVMLIQWRLQNGLSNEFWRFIFAGSGWTLCTELRKLFFAYFGPQPVGTWIDILTCS